MAGNRGKVQDTRQNRRALVLLGARMARTRGSNHWRFPLFLEERMPGPGGLPGEVSGGNSRMRAIQAVYHATRAKDELLVLVTGGIERDGSSRADEAARQLVSRYGLPAEAVISIRGAGSTIGNAEATAEYIERYPHAMSRRSIEIVTNDYHMARAWIIFSKQMREMAGKPKLSISPTEQMHIGQLLREGLPGKSGWSPSQIRKDRQQVMEILQPHFSMRPGITPLVVEEILERQPLMPKSGLRDARLLRNNIWVRRTLRFEYEGIMKLLGCKLDATVER